jgi:hypothetical protein
MRVIDMLSQGGAAALGKAREAADAASPKLKEWVKTGAALGAARAGARVATGVVRRNPGLALAAATIGAGYLAYTAYRKHAAASALANAERDAPIEATATVIETRKRNAGSRRKPASKTTSKTEVTDTSSGSRTRKRTIDG